MVTFTFDPANKYILVPNPTTEIDGLDLYTQSIEWSETQEGMVHDVPMNAVGKKPMGGNVYTDSIFQMQNGWKVKFWSGTYQATINGTVIPEEGETRVTVPPDSGNVEVAIVRSTQATTIETKPAITAQDRIDIADEVWTMQNRGTKVDDIQTQVTDVQSQTTNIEKVQDGRWKIDGSQLIMYEQDGTTVHKTFNLLDKDGNPTADPSKVYERVPA